MNTEATRLFMLRKKLESGITFFRLPRLSRNELNILKAEPTVIFKTKNGFGKLELPSSQYRVEMAGNGGIRRENWETGTSNRVVFDALIKDKDKVRFFIGPRTVSLVQF